MVCPLIVPICGKLCSCSSLSLATKNLTTIAAVRFSRGADYQTRTDDLLITNQLLYQLS